MTKNEQEWGSLKEDNGDKRMDALEERMEDYSKKFDSNQEATQKVLISIMQKMEAMQMTLNEERRIPKSTLTPTSLVPQARTPTPRGDSRRPLVIEEGSSEEMNSMYQEQDDECFSNEVAVAKVRNEDQERPLPFPSRALCRRDEEKFRRFVEILKRIEL